MRDRIKAVFFDIDGTLVSFKTHQVPESAVRAIKRLRERGIKVFIATGRLLRHTEVVNNIEVDGYITVNGSYCITAEGETIFECHFPTETVEKVFALEQKYGFTSALMTHEDIYVDKLEGLPKVVADMINITPAEADRRQIAASQSVLQMCPYIGIELEQEVMPQISECVASRWIDKFMDINMRGIDKSVAAGKVMEYYGLSLSEAMAFGDGGNDLPIVRDAGVGVAMENGCAELKAVADYIAPSVDDDGVAKALEHYNLL